jgi:DNA-binding NarL/FixJ family response regulator
MIRFLLLDDHPALLEFVSLRLQRLDEEWESVVCSTQEEAIAALKTKKIDRALLDLQLDKDKSLEIPQCCDALNIPFGIYTSYLHPAIFAQLKDLNPLVYVVKSAPLVELDNGLRALANGDSFACARTQKCRKEMELSGTTKKGYPLKVTDAEKRVLISYMQGMTTNEIACQLDLTPVTVQNHKARMVQRNGASLQELIQRYLFWTQP